MIRCLSTLVCLFCSVAALLLNGCLGYQLGGTAPAGIKSVYLAPVINKTLEPAIETEVNKALRQRIQFDGRLRLENAGNADAVMEVVLTDYDIHAISYDKDKSSRAREYRLKITADAVLKKSGTGEVISRIHDVYGEGTFSLTSGLTNAKRNVLPAAVSDLARFLLDGLLESW